ncbi:MAG: hypothetical protein SWE60_06910 [Thermodesulfobacteriota bacterium]|nr:hypothetical protein [Thermodesulfobacteriota bacterium]
MTWYTCSGRYRIACNMNQPSQTKKTQRLPKAFISVIRWFDSEAGVARICGDGASGVDWLRVLPFVLLHLSCLLVFAVGWSWTAIGVALALYVLRMSAITGFYHRYFSHRSFKTSRFLQFLFAVAGNAAVHRGPLWRAAHHRHHHRFADQEADIHSPLQHGFWWSHVGRITSRENFQTTKPYVKDWSQYPELLWINRFDTIIPFVLALSLYVLGHVLGVTRPDLNTNGPERINTMPKGKTLSRRLR